MDTAKVKVNLKIQDLMPSYWDATQFKGRLLVATPTMLKPKDISSKKWATAILEAISEHGKFHLAIPLSFWSKKWKTAPIQEEERAPHWIELVDAFSESDYAQGLTPMHSIREIIEVLASGNNVLIPSSSEKISGFVPAMLTMISHDSHPEKIWYPTLYSSEIRHELTQFQFGYIYGMCDVNYSFGLSSLRETYFQR